MTTRAAGPATASAPLLTFEPVEHRYALDGTPIPSVSQIEQLAGIAPNYARTRETMALAGDRGTMIHEATEYLDRGVLDWEWLEAAWPSGWVAAVRAYQAWRAESGFEVEAIEHRGWATLDAGDGQRRPFGFTLDRVGAWHGGRPCFLDVKTGSDIKPRMGVQLAGYAEGYLYAERLKGPGVILPAVWQPHAIDRIVVQLRPDTRKKGGGKPYRVYEYTDASDFDAFRWALGIAWWKIEKGMPMTSGITELPEAGAEEG